jgi:hypothetical protein
MAVRGSRSAKEPADLAEQAKAVFSGRLGLGAPAGQVGADEVTGDHGVVRGEVDGQEAVEPVQRPRFFTVAIAGGALKLEELGEFSGERTQTAAGARRGAHRSTSASAMATVRRARSSIWV